MRRCVERHCRCASRYPLTNAEFIKTSRNCAAATDAREKKLATANRYSLQL